MSLEGDCHKLEVTPNLELLVTFGMSLEGVCHNFTTNLHLIWRELFYFILLELQPSFMHTHSVFLPTSNLYK